MRRVAVALAAVVLLVRPAIAAADPALPPSTVAYRPPVAGPVVDPYDPPEHPWDAGNRGVDYQTHPGEPVAAAADGEVVFAGQVGGTLHVVVLHADGIRTSYSFLQSIAVHRGDRVHQGQAVGTAGERVHFGARVGDEYVDPTRLFGDGPPEVHLVPDEARRPGTEDHERKGLLDSLVGLAKRGAGATAAGIAWARDQGEAAARALADDAVAGSRLLADQALSQLAAKVEELKGLLAFEDALSLPLVVLRELRAVGDWYAQRDTCTPIRVAPPPLESRHIAVEVAGFGSSSRPAAVDDVADRVLGYAPGDTIRFSYAGGTTNNRYDGRTSSQDIRVSGRLLRQLLQQVARDHPGVPVDIIAHSQGGIVARQALAMEADAGDPALPPINALVLLGTPNQGADLGNIAGMVGQTMVGRAGEEIWTLATPEGADITGPAIHQLSETSAFMERLNHTPLPPGVQVTSIGARTDPIVPGRRTRLAGADNIIVDSGGGFSTHSELPGSDEATREISLAIHRMHPTCQSLADVIADETVSEAITFGENFLGRAAWLTGRWVDHGMSPRIPVRYEEAS